MEAITSSRKNGLIEKSVTADKETKRQTVDREAESGELSKSQKSVESGAYLAIGRINIYRNVKR